MTKKQNVKNKRMYLRIFDSCEKPPSRCKAGYTYEIIGGTSDFYFILPNASLTLVPKNLEGIHFEILEEEVIVESVD